MSDVILAGIGQTPVREHWEISLRELGFEAMNATMQDAGGLKPQALFVGNMLAPILSHQTHLAALLTDFAGLTGIEAVVVEAANASGGAALRQAYLAVKSGMIDSAMVVGVEKFTDTIGAETEAALATSVDSDFESIQGLTPTSQAALLTRRYLHNYQVPVDGLACFPLLAHSNAANNPNAMYQKPVKLENYQRADIVSDPLNIFDVAPNGDGAAGLLITRRDKLPQTYHHPIIRISSSAQASDTLSLNERQDPLFFKAVHLSTAQAIKRANLALDKVDFLEYHDAYSIYAAISLESAGFFARGQSWKTKHANKLSTDGKLPCATMGGLKARGNPGGATGIYQAVEAVLQLRGMADKNQVPGARCGMIQSMGGPGCTVVTHIFECTEV